MKFRTALAAATMLALPLVANAQPLNGMYIAGGLGVNIMHDENATITAPGAVGYNSGRLNSRLGPAFDLSIGYQLPFGLRAELEGSGRYNTFNSADGATSAGGTEQKYGAMVNVLYDIVGIAPYGIEPYVGVGAGYQWAQENNLHITNGVVRGTASNNTIGDFAYQGIVGAAFPIAGMPGLALTADYRYMGLIGDRHYGGTLTEGAVTLPARFKLNDDTNNTVLIGFRYAFGAPAPAPVAPAPAAVAPSPVSRSYIVFFDWDKADLTDRARQIVSEAAANSTKVQYTRLEVNGYTDTSGTPAYNQGLSVRRAQTVAAELVKDGVPKSAISIQGFGETHLLVPTGAGVREPQNRRVEIIIR